MKNHFQSLIKLIKTMESNTERHRGASYYGALRTNGTTTVTESTACFAASNRDNFHNSKVFVNHVQSGGIYLVEQYHADIVAYYNWLFNVSPWASVFISKSGEVALNTRFIYADATSPSDLLIQAMQACRVVTEYHNIATTTVDLQKAGVEPNLAFLLASCMRGGKGREGSVDWDNDGSEHQVFSGSNLNPQSVERFLNNRPSKLNKPYSEDTQYSANGGLRAIWCKGTSGMKLTEFIRKHYDAKKILNGGVEQSTVCLNPFKKLSKVKGDLNLIEYGDGIKSMAIFAPTIQKEFIDNA